MHFCILLWLLWDFVLHPCALPVLSQSCSRDRQCPPAQTLLSEQGIIFWGPTLPPAHGDAAGWVWQPGWLSVGSDSSRSTGPECCRGMERSFSHKCHYTNTLEPCVLFNCSPRKGEFLGALLLSESEIPQCLGRPLCIHRGSSVP